MHHFVRLNEQKVTDWSIKWVGVGTLCMICVKQVRFMGSTLSPRELTTVSFLGLIF